MKRKNADDGITPTEVLSLLRACVTGLRTTLTHYVKSPQQRAAWTDEAMVILTGVGVIVALGSAWIFQGQLTTARTSMQTDQRAWVVPRPGNNEDKEVPVTVTPSRTLSYPIIFRNAGKTPALNFQAEMYLEIVPSNSAPHFERVGDGHPNTIVISPIIFPSQYVGSAAERKHKIPGTNWWEDEPAKESEAQELIAGTAYFAVFGYMTYRDVFHNEHWMKFCLHTGNSNTQFPGAKQCAEYTAIDP